MGLTDKQQAVSAALAFVLIAIQGFLQQQSFITENLAIQIVILLIPVALIVVKELAGSVPSGPGGLLTDQQQALLLTVAALLMGIGATLSATTTNPAFLLAFGLIGAAVAGLKEWLGSAPPTT